MRSVRVGPVGALSAPPVRVGESPLWHPVEACLYWCDVVGRCLHRHEPASGRHHQWGLPSEPACCVPIEGGGLLLAMRDGLWRFDTATGGRDFLAPPPYDPARQRFNDGKADPHGRFWVATIDDDRQPLAALYRWTPGAPGLDCIESGFANGNGLAFSADGRTLFWADTRGHAVSALALDAQGLQVLGRRSVHQFAARASGQALDAYGGRPDGAAVDAEGGYWVAMFEGQRLVRLSARGDVVDVLPLPVRCPTMPCFGGPDLRTLYITTAREGRPADELAAQPLAGRVLQVAVSVAGRPPHMVRLPRGPSAQTPALVSP